MKTLLVLLGLVMGVSASAAPSKQIQYKLKNGDQSSPMPPEQTDPVESTKPIRVATARYKVTRYEYTKLPDGSYDFKKTVLCTGDVNINVFDVRNNGTVVNGPIESVQCADTIAQKAIWVGGALTLTNEELIDVKEDVKYAFGMLTVSVLGNGTDPVIQPIESMETSSGGTKDINAKSFVLGMMPARQAISVGTVFYSGLLDIKD